MFRCFDCCHLNNVMTIHISYRTAPYKDVKEAVRKGTLGHLNPTPWAVMTGCTIGWVTYSYLINNLFLFFTNAPGLILSVWLNMAAAKLQYSDRISKGMRAAFVELLDRNRQSFRRLDRGGDELDKENNANDTTNDVHSFANMKQMALDITIQKAEAPAPHEKIVVGVVTFWVSVISLLYFLQLDISQWKYVIGIITNINTCMFYGAPLSTIYTVIKERDSSSIHRPTMIMNTCTAAFLTAFGFGVKDLIIIIPNGIGAILGFIQIFLRLVVPARSSTRTEATTSDQSIAKRVDETKAAEEVTAESLLRMDRSIIRE